MSGSVIGHRGISHRHGIGAFRHSGILQQPHPQQQLFGAGSRWHEFRVLSSTRPSGSSAIELSLGRILDVVKSNSAAPARCRTARDRRGNAEPTRIAMSAALALAS